MHRVRTGTTWSGIGNVFGQTGNIGNLDEVSATMWNGDLHVVVSQHSTHHLFHTIRFANGSWTGFGDVEAVVGNIGAVGHFSLTTASDGVHLFVSDAAGAHLYHTIRFPNGSWASWTDLTRQRTFPSPIGRIAAAYHPPNFQSADYLHLLVADSPAKPTPPRHLYYTSLHPNGSLDSLSDVSSLTGSSNVDFSVGLAVGGDLQVVAIDSELNELLLHSIRSTGGQWTPFGNVLAAAAGIGFTPFPYTPAVELDDGLHVFVPQDSGTLEAVRQPSGAWIPFHNELPDMQNGTSTVAAVAGTPQTEIVK